MLTSRRPAWALTLIAFVVATTIVLAPTAGAKSACGLRATALPTSGVAAGKAPLALGDSVLYDAVSSLSERGFEANGMICRRIDQGLKILATRKKAGTLPKLVVLELGANGVVTKADIAKALEILGPKRSLVMLTPTDDDPPRGVDAKVIKAAAKTWPTRLRVLDWAAKAKAHPEWMAADGVHLANDDGIAGLTTMISETLSRTPTGPSPAPAIPSTGAGGASAPH